MHAKSSRALQAVLILVCAATPGRARPQDTASGPQVNFVEPASATPGSQLNLKIKGKGFADGARVAFSNPAIRVLGAKVKSSELTVGISVPTGAATGSGSLFVINPDDNEVEARFDVIAGNPVVTETVGSSAPSAGSGSPSPAAKTSSSAAKSQDFEVYNLGNVASILGGGPKTKGTLTVASGKLKYTEGDQEIFSARARDVKEIGLNSFLGVNTGTFHVILSSGKTYNFIPSSFRTSDTQSMVDSLRHGLH